MKNLTKKQMKIYEFVVGYHLENGYPPTQAEIRDQFHYRSLNAVRTHLGLIEKKGYFRLDSGKARGIHLKMNPISVIRSQKDSIPLLGDIAAGIPIWAEQNFKEELPIPPTFFGNGELFALHVRGDSMKDAGIRNGDIAVIQIQDSVQNGEIAAVLIEDEATLKRVFFSSDSLLLKADNQAYKDLKFTKNSSNRICILGRYKGIIRSFDNRGI